MTNPHTPDDLSLEDELLVDSICEQFELAQKAGQQPVMADFLAAAPESIRNVLEQELHKVLAACVETRTILDKPLSSTETNQPTDFPLADQQVGPYTLLETIGEGGMGEVWVAQQSEPIRRKVAIKLIKAGMDSRAILARFEQERQTLANLDHPNIARILDAGLTPQQRPYFVMELIDGQRLTTFCNTSSLGLRDRLTLFLEICQAIQHAHQKGIIHRDLKPANILICQYDNKPTVKVIDFGVAKVFSGSQLDESLATQAGSIVGTWEYMAPEQAGSLNNDIDTRADVYSLGAVLYELLTGSRPFDSQRLRESSIEQAIQIIREEEPPRPSKRLVAQLAEQDQHDLELVSILRGDLDWIVMKCLEKNRIRRYDSVASLARDIQRYLANEPIEARPPSIGYRLSKFIRRNRLAVAVSSAIVLAFALAFGATAWGLIQAREANAETRKMLAELTFANDNIFDVFTDFDIRRVKQEADPVEYVLADRLVAASKRLTPEAISDPTTRVRLQNRLGLTLLSLDRPRDAIPLFQFAAQTQTELFGEDHPEVLETKTHLAEAYREAGQPTQALELYIPIHAKLGALFGHDHTRTVTAKSNLAAGYLALGQPQEALSLYDQVLAWRTAHLGEHHHDTQLSMNNLAACYAAVGERTKAVPLYEKVLALRKVNLGPDHADTLLSYNNLASALLAVDRLDVALPLLEQAVALHKAKLGPDHRQTLACMGNLAGAYRRTGRLRESVATYEQTVSLMRLRLGPTHPDTLLGMNNLANLYRITRRLDQAIPLFEEALAGQQTVLSDDHPDTLLTINNLAYAYHEANALRPAIALYQRALSRQRSKLGVDHPETQSSIGNLAVAYADAGQGQQAAPLFAELLTLRRKKSSGKELAFAATLTQVATYLFRVRQFAAAEPHLREGLELREKFAADQWGTSYARSMLGRALAGQKKYQEAERYLVSGYEQLRNRHKTIPSGSINTVFEAGMWLEDYYHAIQQPAKALEIRKSLPFEVAPLPRVVSLQ